MYGNSTGSLEVRRKSTCTVESFANNVWSRVGLEKSLRYMKDGRRLRDWRAQYVEASSAI